MKRVALLVLAAAVLIIPVWYSARTAADRGRGSKASASWRWQDLFTRKEVREAERAREDRLRSEQSAALVKCVQAVQVFTDALAEIDQWEKRAGGLLRSDEGREVSADLRFVREFAELRSRPRASRVAISSTLTIAQTLEKDLEQAQHRGSLFVPEFAQMLELEKGTSLAGAAQGEYRRDRERLEALLASAERKSAEDAVLLETALQRELERAVH